MLTDASTFEYTKVFFNDEDYQSSFVEAVYYNSNDNTVVVDLDGNLYKYSDVGETDVASLVSADSVGGYFNTNFQPVFGPSEELGRWDEVYSILSSAKKDETSGTPKGLVDARPQAVTVESGTKEYDLNRFDTPESHDVFGDSAGTISVGEGATKEYSLTLPEAEVVETGDVRVRVHFTLEGHDRKFKYDAKATEVEDAIDELHEYVSRFGAKGRVRKVVVKFD